MKKLFSLHLCVFFVLSFLITLTSCEKPKPKLPITDFSASMSVIVNDMEIQGEFSNTRQGLMSFSVKSPQTIEGMKYNYQNGELTLALDDLSCVTIPEYLPSTNYIKQIHSCMELLNNETKYVFNSAEENINLFTANSQEGEFKIYCNKDTGIIDKIETNDAVAEFSNQKSFQEN